MKTGLLDFEYRPDKSAEAKRSGFFTVGDLGRVDATATSTSRAGRRRSSSPVASTSTVRDRTCCSPTPTWSMRRWRHSRRGVGERLVAAVQLVGADGPAAVAAPPPLPAPAGYRCAGSSWSTNCLRSQRQALPATHRRDPRRRREDAQPNGACSPCAGDRGDVAGICARRRPADWGSSELLPRRCVDDHGTAALTACRLLRQGRLAWERTSHYVRADDRCRRRSRSGLCAIAHHINGPDDLVMGARYADVFECGPVTGTSSTGSCVEGARARRRSGALGVRRALRPVGNARCLRRSPGGRRWHHR